MNIRLSTQRQASQAPRFEPAWAGEEASPGLPLKDLGEILARPGGERSARRFALGLGAKEKARTDTFRCAGGLLAKWLAKHDIAEAAVDFDAEPLRGQADRQAALLEGFLLGGFRFDLRKSSPGKRRPVVLHALVGKARPEHQALLRRVEAVCGGVNLAREWAHEPPNVIRPVTLARRIAPWAKRCGLACRVLDEKQLTKIGAGAILAVGQGSDSPPRLIVLEHRGSLRGRQRGTRSGRASRPESPVVLIGKAITFDTGGYTLKDRVGMVGMKYDKCGGMAVLGAMQAVAALKPRTPVVGIIAAAENMISGGAYRPNDIITTMSGKTVEIISADAEGRLVLADALTYAQREYQPRCMINLATLTGGVSVALGNLRAGLMGNNDALCSGLFSCGERVHERLWRLPLDDEYFDLIAGDDSDFKNSAERLAHAIVGGIFLKQFVDARVPWAHLDIAGTAHVDRDQPYCPKGATGFGVRLLLEHLLNTNATL
ncbi:MAG: leucyl aminopeptidase [Phycisphaerae bacterium]|nr:MAG: leucyl aminopeptidase [Planctomycetota bacterium]KAB2949713.1 MAG: leucyl aminopeptidase [Phycisphaerae bacterium]MBE7457528.1 leucyl aminopeptidase [Planctomycetia bacterium]MCK6464567.1 leucyl aminopeptidase [Phycisphaerae bacterium]MCL4718904.1 leucyl aminopeptidase [Phycisphaerae bacterium]